MTFSRVTAKKSSNCRFKSLAWSFRAFLMCMSFKLIFMCFFCCVLWSSSVNDFKTSKIEYEAGELFENMQTSKKKEYLANFEIDLINRLAVKLKIKSDNFVNVHRFISNWLHFPFTHILLSPFLYGVCWFSRRCIRNIGSLWRQAIECDCIYVQSRCNRWTVMFAVGSKGQCFVFRAYTTRFDVTGKVFYDWLIAIFFWQAYPLFAHFFMCFVGVHLVDIFQPNQHD